eukprot:UN18939
MSFPIPKHEVLSEIFQSDFKLHLFKNLIFFAFVI